MIDWDAARLAAAAGARVIRARDDATGPQRVTIDSRDVGPGDLFLGLPGERVDGGTYAAQALRAGAWGVLVAPAHAARVAGTHGDTRVDDDDTRVDDGDTRVDGAVLAHPDPLLALQVLARSWRRALGAKVLAITGSTGKTSTKDILAAVLAGRRRTAASPQNLNTEIGLPLAVLAAPAGTEALVLELAMRGPGQIAELAAIAEPDVGVIVNVGPVHLELLGSLEAIAAAKAELIAALAPGATVVIPAHEPLLEAHLRSDLRTVTFGEGGDVELAPSQSGEGAVLGPTRSGGAAELEPTRSGGDAALGTSPPPDHRVAIIEHAPGEPDLVMSVEPSFTQSHNLRNLLAAVAAARALGVTPGGKLDVAFSALRGERVALTDGIVLINDCYNANPMSMRAALDDLAASAPARRVAVLGDMLELGDAHSPALHREVGAYAQARGVELLVTVGPQAAALGEQFDGELHHVADAAAVAALLPTLLRADDTVLVKGSRGVGLELVAERLSAAARPAAVRPANAAARAGGAR